MLFTTRGQKTRIRGVGRARSCAAAERGQSMVEFMLIFPIFILIVIGMLEFGTSLQRAPGRELRQP